MTNPSDYDIRLGSEVEQLRNSQRVLAPFDWFSRLWGVAVIAHIIGNPRIGQAFGDATWLGWSTLLTGLLAVGLVMRPDNRELLRWMSVGVVITVWFEAPFIGNHWLLAGIVSIAILIGLSTGDSWNWFSQTARGVHLVFYGFAAFSKLNAGFFDTQVSCGVFYANQGLDSLGLPGLESGTLLAAAAVLGTAVIELSIPVLLVMRRTRNVGIVLGLAFHILISFDLDQHFYDFTAVLIPLFLLWACPSLPQPLSRPLGTRVDMMLGSLLGLLVVISVAPLGRASGVLLTDAVFLVWIPASIALVIFVVRRMGLTSEFTARPPNAMAWVLVGIVVLNGLAPFLELKTATSWNMYSNLYTVDGESNHFVIRATLPLSNSQSDPVEILESSDSGLMQYAESGYLLPERNLLHYLADNPGVEATVVQRGVVKQVTSSDGVALNPLLERFALLRAIDTEQPPPCQTTWLPAR